MTHDYWGLNESPFSSAADRYFHRTPNTEEALARLHFLVAHRRRVGLLLGASGVGKSRLLAMFARKREHGGRQVAMLSALGVGPAELLGQVALEFGLNPSPSATVAAAWRTLDDFFAASRYQDLESVLLVDDADEAEPEAVTQLARLAQIAPARDGRLTLLLAGRESHLAALGSRLLELAELRIDVAPWQADETACFVDRVLAAAGAQSEIFSPAAVLRLHEFTDGVPRRVKQLAELCLLAGAGAELASIDASTVASVFYELGVVAPSAAPSAHAPTAHAPAVVVD